MLSADDHRRIEAAVATAEEGTSGDIFCVLAGEVSSYREVPIAWAAAVALLVPPIVVAVSLGPLLGAISGGWTAAQAGALAGQVGWALTGYAVLQLVLFALTALVVSLTPVRRALTPRFLKRHRVRKAALHHFVAAHSHAADSETGVVIFVALVERQVEILADAKIHERCGESPWAEAARAVSNGMKSPDPTSGIERAIAICGQALKAHFPSDAPRAKVDRPIDD